MKIVLARLSISLLIALGVLSLLSVAGCSSSTPTQKSRYYLLNSHQLPPKMSNKIALSVKKTVVVSVLELPAYLHQPYLVLQLDAHQLHYARFDMWAEPLQTGLSKALLSDLNKNSGNTQYIAALSNVSASETEKMMIQVDYFHPNHNSTVTLSGNYWMQKGEKVLSVQQPFSFELVLKQDGYTHAIEKMRLLVSLLSQNILNFEKE